MRDQGPDFWSPSRSTGALVCSRSRPALGPFVAGVVLPFQCPPEGPGAAPFLEQTGASVLRGVWLVATTRSVRQCIKTLRPSSNVSSRRSRSTWARITLQLYNWPTRNKIEFQYHAMNKEPHVLNSPPFPLLTWEGDLWQGVIDLEFGNGVTLLALPFDESVTRVPSNAQRDALVYHISHGQIVIQSVLAAMRRYYDEMRPRYLDFLGPKAPNLMPSVQSLEELRPLIGLMVVWVHPWTKEGMAFVGLEFHCTWDQEHGVGVLMHRDRVVSIGDADHAFAIRPNEADSSTRSLAK